MTKAHERRATGVRRRAKNLSDEDIKRIAVLLDGWTGKLAWAPLINAIELTLFNRYTRQALYKHERIRHAFELRKAKLNEKDEGGHELVSPQLRIALERISRLEIENHRLESENNVLLEQYARWAYNAHTRGLGQDFLNRPLPSVNRGQTKR